jgi:hypothetical protein
MKRKRSQVVTLAAGAAVSALVGAKASGQTVDALLNKLVEKGTLTQQEANELKKESNDGFNKAYQTKSGMPDWVTALKFNGDFRGRYENFSSQNDAFVERGRFRYRLRFGVVATLKDNLEVGMRLSSSETGLFGGDPISGNTTLQDNASRKPIFVDLAYGKWTFLNEKEYSSAVTIGKMENPFVMSDDVFDPDYNPEGLGYNFTYRLNDAHTLKFNGGAFLLDEIAASHQDPYMYGGQVSWDATWSKAVTTMAGIALLNIVNEQSLGNATVPNGQRGNTRDPGTTAPAVNFNPIVVDAAATYTFDNVGFYPGRFPVKVHGEYANNLAISSRETSYYGGVTFGKAAKKGTWELTYRYKSLGGDSWYEEMTDSDFGAFYQGTWPNGGLGPGYGAGTNVRGHHVKAVYALFDAMTLGITYGRTHLIDEFPAGSNSDMSRLIVDAIWKF